MIEALYKVIIPLSTDMATVLMTNIKLKEANYKPPASVFKNDDGVHQMNGKIWTPNDAANLKLMIAVRSQCVENKHIAYAATIDMIDCEYWLVNMKREIKELIKSCTHCNISRHGERISRPLATAILGEKLNIVTYAKFIYMGPARRRNLKYILIIKDDISSYTWICPSENADSDAAKTAQDKWISCFGNTDWLVTYQGSHLRSSLMSNLTTNMFIKHHFTTDYCHWSKSTGERACKEVITIERS